MKAFLLDGYGKQRALRLSEVPEPVLTDDDVLVQVHAASVNQLDSKIKTGEFKLILSFKMPLILGHDVAGVVAKVGRNVKSFQPGDEVYARVDGDCIGSFAELVCVRASSLALKPKNLSMAEAASIPLVGLTAWQAFVGLARLRKGQKVFIQAGSGGVGTFAIQLAKHLGAVVATTTSATNTELVKRLGADVVIDYRSQDFAKALTKQDLVLHSQDNQALKKSLQIVRRGGQIISISGPPDLEFGVKVGAPLPVRLVMRFLSWGVRRQARALGVGYSFLYMQPSGDQLREITRLIEAGSIRPVVDKVFPFEATNEALAYVESGRARGKVVIKIQ